LYLYNTRLPLPPKPVGAIVPKPAHDVKYWARVTKGMNFRDADRVDGAAYNRILWKGIMGNKPYPATPTGLDLRQNREELLARYRRSLKQKGGAGSEDGHGLSVTTRKRAHGAPLTRQDLQDGTG